LISADAIRGYTDTMILSLLLDEPSYGYEVSREIRNRSDGRYVMKETTLYSAFNRLEKQGFIESFKGTESNGKQRTYYRISEKGIEYYKSKCREWEEIKKIVPAFIRYDVTEVENE
jgi:PadR family transcriptional regulator PadR